MRVNAVFAGPSGVMRGSYLILASADEPLGRSSYAFPSPLRRCMMARDAGCEERAAGAADRSKECHGEDTWFDGERNDEPAPVRDRSADRADAGEARGALVRGGRVA